MQQLYAQSYKIRLCSTHNRAKYTIMKNPVEPFRFPFAEQDETLVAKLMASLQSSTASDARIDAHAMQMIAAIRSSSSGIGSIEDVLQAYSLATKEGLALMVLAEALLRVPDAVTSDKLIEDKLAAADWSEHKPQSLGLLTTATSWALGLSSRVIQPGETPDGVLAAMVKRLGVPTIRAATRQAMRLMGNYFVLGETIDSALDRARKNSADAPGRMRYSYDMLGEGARTATDAERYYQSYVSAIDAIGRSSNLASLPERPGISVKLSALHPRYEAVSSARVMIELVPRVISLATKAKEYNLNFTLDAEEADRLELSLDVMAAVLSDTSLAGWSGFGLAIQAYQKRGLAVIDWVVNLAEQLDRTLMVRLVKGAYWDSEIKRTQERGLDDYPVFTRKAATDLNYIICAQKMLGHRPRIYPQFATHNALTIATIIEMAGGAHGYEFQRLHGMGDEVYKSLLASNAAASCRVYAPVGGHKDLLAYLVRRLLENGANSSFVSMAADKRVAVSDLLKKPSALLGTASQARNRSIPQPAKLYGDERPNSVGVEFGHAETLKKLCSAVAAADGKMESGPVINGVFQIGIAKSVVSPIDAKTRVGSVMEANKAHVYEALTAASHAFAAWQAVPVVERAAALHKTADDIQRREARLIALLQREAGKTLDDAIAEIREAIDFCRYYAAQALKEFGNDTILPGPTGEDNRLRYRGRGVFVCISPWNFPLAIFIGQIAAALVAGNTVVAKPAPQTPLIAMLAVEIMHGAGVPVSALQLLPGGGDIGAALVSDVRTAGVAFTGSTKTAWAINRTLANRDAPIVPFIAETGGINAMIVDGTALPEQVTDDVIMSSFRSAGQRCSALRLLCVQEDIADKIIEMIRGAAEELKIGDPRDPATHIGPVIDADALHRLQSYVNGFPPQHRKQALLSKLPLPEDGYYMAPHLFEIANACELKIEIFGPVLHIVRWKATALDTLLDDLSAMGYGLTLGIHSRINTTIDKICARLSTGNVYINRNMIGAVVGTQPFGGTGLSGTGPKAGGPNYLRRFACEQVITVNIAAAGGNAALLAGTEI